MVAWFLIVVPVAALLAPIGYHLGYRRSGPARSPSHQRFEPSGPTAAAAASTLFAPAPASSGTASSVGSADDSYDRWDQLATDLDEATRWGWLADVGWIAFVVALLLVALRLAA